ncbi:MAG: LysM peptidoglycan-binding domain-containing protein [Verrucomicrobiota bacterium]
MRQIGLFALVLLGCQSAVFSESGDLYTNTYVVPPTFLSGPQAHQWRDPFEEPAMPRTRATAKQILEQAGITFGEGASAVYNPSTSQLIVRNTQDQMELVEAYIDSIRSGVEVQIYITWREVYLSDEALEQFKELELWDVSIEDPGPIRAWSQAMNSRRDFLEELGRPPSDLNEAASTRTEMTGVYTDPQFQVVIRALQKIEKGVEVISPPSVMTRSGQPALVQMANRRFGVVPVIGADEFTIDLEIFVPSPGEAMGGIWGEIEPSARVTVWDGQSVSITQTRAGDPVRLVFIKAQLMDPAGMPIERPAEKPSEDAGAGIFSRENQDRTKLADEAALRGSQLLADGDISSAVEYYRKALEQLPTHPLVEPRRKAYLTQLEAAETQLQLEAREATPSLKAHIVLEGETLFSIARQYGVSVERISKDNGIADGVIEVGQLLSIRGVDPATAKEPPLARYLREVLLTTVKFDDVSFAECLASITQQLTGTQEASLFPSQSIRVIVDGDAAMTETKVTLHLSQVPASLALRYLCSLAQYSYTIDGDTILVTPLPRP